MYGNRILLSVERIIKKFNISCLFFNRATCNKQIFTFRMLILSQCFRHCAFRPSSDVYGSKNSSLVDKSTFIVHEIGIIVIVNLIPEADSTDLDSAETG